MNASNYKDKRHQYYLEHREEILAKAKIRQKESAKQIAESKHRRYLRDKEIILAKSRAFRDANRVRLNAEAKERKIKKVKSATDVPCVVCGKPTRVYYKSIYRTCSEICERALTSRNTTSSKNPMWKGGLPKCIDCSKTVSRYTKIKRCRSCGTKARTKNNTSERQQELRISHVLESTFRRLVKGKIRTSTNYMKYLGCSVEEMRAYLERKFEPGMTWDNFGRYGWHIDHIKPLSGFKLTDEAEIAEAYNYKNLQPLWWFENIRKAGKQNWEGLGHTCEKGENIQVSFCDKGCWHIKNMKTGRTRMHETDLKIELPKL